MLLTQPIPWAATLNIYKVPQTSLKKENMIHFKDPNFQLLNAFSFAVRVAKLLGDFFHRSRVNSTHEPTSFPFFLKVDHFLMKGIGFSPQKIYVTHSGSVWTNVVWKYISITVVSFPTNTHTLGPLKLTVISASSNDCVGPNEKQAVQTDFVMIPFQAQMHIFISFWKGNLPL